MDIQSFIQSGILEAYVLNQCSPAERAEVERMAVAHPEVRSELAAIEQTLEQVALANAVPPPAGLKEQILQQLADGASYAPTAGKGFPLLTALLWTAVVLLGAALVWQVNQKNEAAEQVSVLQKQVDECKTRTEEQAKMQDIIALLRDRNTRTIVLSDAAPDAKTKTAATVWHNPVRSETVLDINTLPAPEAGRYFQFWAIVGGKPVSMGMVALRGAGSWQVLPFIQNAEAFAISSEDNPSGNPVPTVVVLVGKV